jgi:hypothetical protein
MPFNAINWATDVNYPAGADTWSGTPTKVAPSAGVQADGFAPRDRPPAQWINWLFNSLVTSGQDLETLVGNASLQRAWDRSQALGATNPHILLSPLTNFRVGSTVVPNALSVSSTDTVSVNRLVVQTTTDIPMNAGQFALTGAGVFNALLTHDTAGVVGDVRYSSGTWDPDPTGYTGSAGAGDFTTRVGYFVRIGNIVTFSFSGTVVRTGWSTALTHSFLIPLPVATTFAAGTNLIGTVTADFPLDLIEPATPSAPRLSVEAEVGGANRLVLRVDSNLTSSFNVQATGQYLIA